MDIACAGVNIRSGASSAGIGAVLVVVPLLVTIVLVALAFDDSPAAAVGLDMCADARVTADDALQHHPLTGAPRNYVFRVSLNDGIQTSFMIDHIKKKKYTRIGLMHDSTGWGQRATT